MMVPFGTNGTTWTQLPPLTWYESYERFGYADLGRKIVITPNYVYVSAPGNSAIPLRRGVRVSPLRPDDTAAAVQGRAVDPVAAGRAAGSAGDLSDGRFGTDFADRWDEPVR